MGRISLTLLVPSLPWKVYS